MSQEPYFLNFSSKNTPIVFFTCLDGEIVDYSAD
jgi:hypothetical protein